MIADSCARARHLRDGRQPRAAITCAAWSRDATSSARFADIRTVEAGDRCPHGGTIHDRARDRGRQHLQARHALLGAARTRPTSTRTGSERPIVMGSYGIGPARIAAAAVEQYADEHGHLVAARRSRRSTCTSSASASPAPTSVELRRAPLRRAAEARASTCSTTTATSRPGEKFVEAELLGCPLRVVAGKRSLESGELEVQVRRGTREALGADRGRRRRADRAARRAALMTRGVSRARTLRPEPRRRPEPPQTRAGRAAAPAHRSRTWSATLRIGAARRRSSWWPSPPTTGASRFAPRASHRRAGRLPRRDAGPRRPASTAGSAR